MSGFVLSDDQVAAFHQDGFVIIDGLLDAEETELLGRIARADAAVQNAAQSRADGEGGAVALTLRNELADDIYSAIVRSESLVRAVETVLDDEVYHYHHKLILKQPRDGGAWAWHQDYGYWYNFCCPFPLLASCMIAIDRATPENGCLQVIRGSHRMGRVDHGKTGDQTGADPERVEVALERLELVHCSLDPGQAILFHCNLLHRSDQNRSENPRWAFICCYNARSNNPYRQVRHPQYTPLETWPDSRILDTGRAQWATLESAVS